VAVGVLHHHRRLARCQRRLRHRCHHPTNGGQRVLERWDYGCISGKSPRRQIHLVEEADGTWSAIDEGAGVASQGTTWAEALTNLDEAVALHEGEIGELGTDADLRDLGLDPDTVPDEPQDPDAPWFSE